MLQTLPSGGQFDGAIQPQSLLASYVEDGGPERQLRPVSIQLLDPSPVQGYTQWEVKSQARPLLCRD